MKTRHAERKLWLLLGALALVALVLLSGRVSQTRGAIIIPTPTTTPPPTRELTIVKHTVPSGSPQAFSFNWSGPPPASPPPFSFVLMDGQSVTYTMGTSLVTEKTTTGWTLKDITCTGATNSSFAIIGASGGTAAFEPGDDTVSIHVAGVEHVTCTFTNSPITPPPPCSINISKAPVGGPNVPDPTDVALSFSFNASWQVAPYKIGPGQTFSAHVFCDHTYSVTEKSTPGWTLKSIDCTVASGTGSFTTNAPSVSITLLHAGDKVSCTFTNSPAASCSINISKAPIEAHAPAFTFNASWQPAAPYTISPGEAFSAQVPCGAKYSVTEKPTPGWTLKNIACAVVSGSYSSGSGSGGKAYISLGSPGSKVSCTFTNSPSCSINISKAPIEAHAPAFTFNTSWQAAPYMISAGQTFSAQVPCDHTSAVTEKSTPGWTLKSIDCTVASGTGSSTSTKGGTAFINLGSPGSKVSCTFTNSPVTTCSVNISKAPFTALFVRDPNDVALLFTFNASWQMPPYMIGPGQTFSAQVPCNAMSSVTEKSTPGWTLKNIACTVVSGTGSTFAINAPTVRITLGAPGSKVSCTFANSPPPVKYQICGIKFNDLNGNGVRDLPQESGLANWTIRATSPTGTYTAVTGAGGSYCISVLGAGVYTVAEQPHSHSHWVQTFPTGGLPHMVTVPVNTSSIDFGNHCSSLVVSCIPIPNLVGDANGDTLVNSIDALFILQFDAGLFGSLANEANADVNGDDAINSIDAALVLQAVAGLISL